MKKALISLWVTLVVTVVLLSSCSSSKSNMATDQSLKMETAGNYGYNESYEYAQDEMMDEDVTADGKTGGAAPSEFPKKLIKTADVVIETKDVIAAYKAILEFAQKNGGYEFNQSTSKNEGSNTVTAIIKIPPEHLDKLLTFAGTNGELIRSETNSDDITDSYYDSKLRLDSLKAQLEKYKTFLNETKNVEDMLRVQREVDRLIFEIETMEGRLSKWDKQVAESTVSFTITQKADPSLKRRDINWNALSFGDMGYLIKSGFVSVLNVIVSVLQWAAIILLITSPLWIVAIIVLRIVFRKKIAAKKQRKKDEKSGM